MLSALIGGAWVTGRNGIIVMPMHQLAQQRGRFNYRRLHILLRRRGDQPQEDTAVLPQGEAGGPTKTETPSRHRCADASARAGTAQPTPEPRIRA